jgi:beta-phosphoglucomutase-like phosphatase (HAD superfamily)
VGAGFRRGRERPPQSSIHHEIGKGSNKLISEFVADGEASERVSKLHGEFCAKLQDRGHPLPGAKPAPDIFELALKRAGSSPEETVAVEASVWDVESEKEAGVRTIAVMTGGGAFSRAELEEAGLTRSTTTARSC